METIRAYVGWNDYTKTHYYSDFKVIEDLPKVNEVYYEDDGRIKTVKAIEKVELDTEQGNDEVYNYRYYKIIATCFNKDTNEKEDDDEYLVCISKENVLREELKNTSLYLWSYKEDLSVLSYLTQDSEEEEILIEVVEDIEKIIPKLEKIKL